MQAGQVKCWGMLGKGVIAVAGSEMTGKLVHGRETKLARE